MSTPKFIVSHEDQQLGPFDESELREKWTSGSILGVDYVYDESKADWIMVAERFRWAADGGLTDTIRVPMKPNEMTEEITVEIALPPPAPVATKARAAATDEDSKTFVVLPTSAVTAPVAPTVVAAPVPTPVAAHATRAIQITDGYGEISLDAMDAGAVELNMRGDDMPTMRIRLDLLPSDPVAVHWALPTSNEVGQTATLSLQVVDERGRTCRQVRG